MKNPYFFLLWGFYKYLSCNWSFKEDEDENLYERSDEGSDDEFSGPAVGSTDGEGVHLTKEQMREAKGQYHVMSVEVTDLDNH